MAKASRMKPGAGGGPGVNAKAEPKQRQSYGKVTKTPPKKPGMYDTPKGRKGSPLGKKK